MIWVEDWGERSGGVIDGREQRQVIKLRKLVEAIAGVFRRVRLTSSVNFPTSPHAVDVAEADELVIITEEDFLMVGVNRDGTVEGLDTLRWARGLL